MSPYWGANFFSFFKVLFSRFLSGEIMNLQADELQIGVLSLISLSSALIGPFLILRKMVMFANALSHTLLLGIALVFLIFGVSIFSSFAFLALGALFAAFLTAFLTEGLKKWFRVSEDASIGLIFTSLFALGIVLVSLYMKEMHLGIESVMGNADVLQLQDLKTGALLCLMNGAFVFVFYPFLKISSFDSFLAKTLGIKTSLLQFALQVLVAITCIAAFRAVGVVLVLALLIIPFMTARLFSSRLKTLIFLTAGIGILASVIAVAITRHVLSTLDLPISTSGTLVLVLGSFYFLATFIDLYFLPTTKECDNLSAKLPERNS